MELLVCTISVCFTLYGRAILFQKWPFGMPTSLYESFTYSPHSSSLSIFTWAILVYVCVVVFCGHSNLCFSGGSWRLASFHITVCHRTSSLRSVYSYLLLSFHWIVLLFVSHKRPSHIQPMVGFAKVSPGLYFAFLCPEWCLSNSNHV